MRIQHNIMAMNAYRNYANNTSALSKNLEKLSSGYKINRAGDDAAGLAISEKMRAQITGLDKAQDNYRQAMKKLSSGRGNVLSQAEAFRSLGVEIKREINPELAEQATTQDEEYRFRSVPETQQDAPYPEDEAVNQQSN